MTALLDILNEILLRYYDIKENAFYEVLIEDNARYWDYMDNGQLEPGIITRFEAYIDDFIDAKETITNKIEDRVLREIGSTIKFDREQIKDLEFFAVDTTSLIEMELRIAVVIKDSAPNLSLSDAIYLLNLSEAINQVTFFTDQQIEDLYNNFIKIELILKEFEIILKRALRYNFEEVIYERKDSRTIKN